MKKLKARAVEGERLMPEGASHGYQGSAQTALLGLFDKHLRNERETLLFLVLFTRERLDVVQQAGKIYEAEIADKP